MVCNQMTTTDNPAIHPLCPVHLERSERAGVEERNEVKEAGSVWAEGKETRGGSGWYVHVHVCVCVCVCVCGGREVVDLSVAMRETAAVFLKQLQLSVKGNGKTRL